MAFTIAGELSRYRINVNVIEPGWIDTPGEHEAFGDAVMAQAGAALPWGRLGTPADIGKAAVFLASDDADYITGTALRVDRRNLAPTRQMNDRAVACDHSTTFDCLLSHRFLQQDSTGRTCVNDQNRAARAVRWQVSVPGLP